MSLRFKINAIVGLLTLLFVATVLGLHLRGVHAAVNEEVQAASRVAAQMLNRTTWRYAAQGTPGMLAFLQGVGRVRANDLMLYGADGSLLYRSPPSPYKAGRDAPAWFAMLVEPTPIEQVIDLPDGRLVMRSDASRAVLDAWDELAYLGLAALLVLLVVNGLVFWVVGRAVRPVGRIVAALNRVEAGRFDEALPALPGREVAAIAAAFNRMVGMLQHNIENERRAAQAEQQLASQRELHRWIEHHVEQERRMIARELHDEFGQSVTAIRSMATSVAQRAQARSDETSAQAARLIADESSRLYDAMHGLIPRLTPLVLDRFGLTEALQDLAERTRRSHAGVQVELHLRLDDDQPVGPDTAIALYRAAQEGITNALRHGKAQHLELSLTAAGPPAGSVPTAGLVLTLLDDGQGLPADPAQTPVEGHYGLRWLRERVEALQGTMRLQPRSPRGASLQVWVPTEGTMT